MFSILVIIVIAEKTALINKSHTNIVSVYAVFTCYKIIPKFMDHAKHAETNFR